MKLFHSPTSPFVRKVVIAAIETGQAADMELSPASPADPDEAFAGANAIHKVPALITDDGVALPESDAICLYLDARSGGKLIPSEGTARWTTIRRQALADGFMEAAVVRRGEDARTEGSRSQADVDKLMNRMLRCLDAMEAEAAEFGDGVDLGVIATACALGYAEFRYADLDWRSGRPNLSKFYDAFSERASMTSTEPPRT